MAKQQKFGGDVVVEAITSYAWHDPRTGTGVVIRAGSKWAGDDPAVLANAQFYIPAGRPGHEREAALRAIHATDAVPIEHVPMTRIPEPLADEDACVPCAQVIGVPAGKRMRFDDPAVREQPDAFVRVIGKGRTRENSLVALAGMSHRAGDGTVTTVHEGMYVAESDPMVQLHPLQFAVPARRVD